MARGITSFTIRTDPALSFDDQFILAEFIIQHIIDRTRRGRGINGERFRPYSRQYTQDLTSDGLSTRPDLDITGEMLDAIGILNVGEGFIEIGIEPDTFEADKARWNQGGNPRITSRPFMGIPDAEVEALQEAIIAGDPAAQAQRFLDENNVIDRVFGRLTGRDAVQFPPQDLFPGDESFIVEQILEGQDG